MAGPYDPPVKGVAYVFRIQLRDLAIPGSFIVNPTLAAGDFNVDIDGGGLNPLGTTPTVDPAGSTWIKVSLSAGEMNGDNIQFQAIDASATKLWADFGRSIQTTSTAPTDSAGVTTLLSRLSAARATKLDAISLRDGTAQAGAATSITLDAGASATGNLYKWLWVVIESGTGAGQARLITGYDGATQIATVAPNWQTAPNNTSVFALVPAGAIGEVITADTIGPSGIAASSFQAGAVTVSGYDIGQDPATLVFAGLIDSTYSLKQYLEAIGATTAGADSGGPGSPAWKTLDGVTTAVSGTADSSGNRSSITYNLP